MYLLFITSTECPKCKELDGAFKDVEFRKDKLKIFDISEMSGLAEASYYSVLAVPKLLVVSDDDMDDVIFFTSELEDIKKIMEGLKYEDNKEHFP